jgi:uncharacterized protein YqhQ
MAKRFHYGGQAVMEGVMMRGRRGMAVAVRDPGGQIVLHEEAIDGWLYRSRLARLPLVRGVVLLADTLRLGTRALIFSANVAGRDPAASEEEQQEEALTGPTLWTTLAISLSFAVGLFFVLPLVVIGFVDRFIESSLVSNVLEGAIRLALLMGYLVLIGRLPEIRRVFGYHGAEHKTINAYEAGAPLTPASVARFPLAHPRCGTGFLLVVVLLSIAVFALLGRPPMSLRIASRILLVPIIAGIGYEYIRFTATFYGHRIVRWLAAPSLALQRLTTREPDAGMLAVAITALERVVAADQVGAPVAVPPGAQPVEEAGTGRAPLPSGDD